MSRVPTPIIMFLQKKFMVRFMQVWVGHVSREANKCHDFLAKRGCSMTENFVVFDTSPFDD